MIKTAETYHVPVLLEQTVNGLNIQPGGIYIDVTFGGGGHSSKILSCLDSQAHLYSFDQDADAENNIYYAEAGSNEKDHRFIDDPRFTFVRSNFDDKDRGFSFRFDSPLDMRMNKRADMTAADIVNNYPESQLADIFYLYGELKNSRKIANALVRYRQNQKILTTQDFIKATEPLFKREKEKKDMARLFQALRIEVNHEMDALKEMLNSATELLRPGGRLSVITYHSLEDRIVKNVMKSGNPEGKIVKDFFGKSETPYKLINNKVIIPDQEEQENNPRSRSAKLRIAEKL